MKSWNKSAGTDHLSLFSPPGLWSAAWAPEEPYGFLFKHLIIYFGSHLDFHLNLSQFDLNGAFTDCQIFQKLTRISVVIFFFSFFLVSQEHLYTWNRSLNGRMSPVTVLNFSWCSCWGVRSRWVRTSRMVTTSWTGLKNLNPLKGSSTCWDNRHYFINIYFRFKNQSKNTAGSLVFPFF